MGKIIEFIAPVEAIRGNMSGRQDLRYAENDNKAFESPVGRTNYARNYTPRFIGAKIASTGKKYFAVKTKTATKINARTLKAMALLGGAGAIYSTMLRRKDLQPYIQMDRLYQYNVDQLGYTGTFRKFVMDFLRKGLAAKVENFTAQVASISLSFKNPWYDGTMTDGATVKQDILVKFWDQLTPDAIGFAVEGSKGIAKSGMHFNDLTSYGINILNIIGDPDAGGGQPMAMIGDLYLQLDGDYVSYVNHEIVANGQYTLTEIAPA